MGTVSTKPITERDPGPYGRNRACPECGAKLTSYNAGPLCAPCNRGHWPGARITTLAVREERSDLLHELMSEAA